MLKVIKHLNKTGALCECSVCKTEYEVKYRADAKKTKIGHLCKSCKDSVSNMGEITQQKLQNVFNYNTESGELFYRNTNRLGESNTLATINHSAGYLTTRINGKDYLAHRIIYIYMTGNIPEQIDHIDHNRKNNAWSNLRNVNNQQNHLNESLAKNSKTGVTGVCFHKPTGKYRAYIMVNKKQKHLGLFETISEASLARKLANKQHNFHENHGK